MLEDFDRRHGGIPVRYKGWFYYPDGAQREESALGALVEPPADDFQRLTNIVYYHQSRLTKAIAEFDTLKERLAFAAFPDREGLDQLRKLQTLVSERNAAVEEAKKQLAATDEAKYRESVRQSAIENRQRAEQFRSDVKAIRV